MARPKPNEGRTLKSVSVDDFVKKKIRPEYQGIAEMLRDLMRDTAPDAEESVAYGIPVFKGKRIFAVLSPNKEGITFSFTHGSEFEDKYGLLQGKGKVSKHVKIRSLNEADTVALRYYIKQAVRLDSER